MSKDISYELKGMHFTMCPLTQASADQLARDGWLEAVKVVGKCPAKDVAQYKQWIGKSPIDITNGHYLVVTPILLKGTITTYERILYKIHPLGKPCKYDTASYKSSVSS